MTTVTARTHGNAPFNVAVVHGGLGATGEMEPVAAALSSRFGVLEPWQTADTVDGQIEQLKESLESYATGPCTFIGHSWGAWLSFMLAAKYPMLVRKLILVGSAPFEQRFAQDIPETRRNRLGEADQITVDKLIETLSMPQSPEQPEVLSKLGEMISRADAFDPLPHIDTVTPNAEVFERVWPEAEQLRRTGALVEMGSQIRCPVVAIHGAYDPHPVDGVRDPLSKPLSDFRMIVLERCGHTPWIERQACDDFYAILNKELELPNSSGRWSK